MISMVATEDEATTTVVNFALAPGMWAVAELLENNDTDDAKIWKNGSKALTITVTGKANQVRTVKKLLKGRAMIMGWNRTMMHIPTNANDPASEKKNFLYQHGQL